MGDEKKSGGDIRSTGVESDPLTWASEDPGTARIRTVAAIKFAPTP